MRVAGLSCRQMFRILKVPYQTGVTEARQYSCFAHLKEAPLDGNHATASAYEADSSPLKVNLGRGVYKTDEGKNWVLPSVQMAENKILQSLLGHEYLPFSGLSAFTMLTAAFAFGNNSIALTQDRVATTQTISGTGALRVGAEFLSRFLPDNFPRKVLLPDPTYVNHFPIFRNTGFSIAQYRYYDKSSNKLDLQGMLQDIKQAPRSVVLLHACAHNPTGIDPTVEQWKQISDAIQECGHISFFDSAYQGFASGDPDRDAAGFRLFVERGHEVLVAQSYAKNMGLYGQRVGALNIVSSSPESVRAIMSQLNQVIRPMYSNPPLHGSRIVSTVFGDPNIEAQWKEDVKSMANRIKQARQDLVDHLLKLGSTRDWSHITNQIGMFAFSGLSEAEVQQLRAKHVYMNFDGRMSISGINSGNVEYLAKCIHEVTQ